MPWDPPFKIYSNYINGYVDNNVPTIYSKEEYVQ